MQRIQESSKVVERINIRDLHNKELNKGRVYQLKNTLTIDKKDLNMHSKKMTIAQIADLITNLRTQETTVLEIRKELSKIQNTKSVDFFVLYNEITADLKIISQEV